MEVHNVKKCPVRYIVQLAIYLRYKIDENDYLKFFKSCIYIRRNLQLLLNKDIYIVIFVNKSLYILLAFIIR